MKLLVMQQKMIGDVLTSSLLCENLRRHLPGAELHFLAHTNTWPVLLGNPHIDRIHGYPARSARAKRDEVGAALRAEGFDAVIDVYGKRESLGLVRQCRAKRAIGYRKWYTPLFYSDPVPRVARSRRGLPLAIEHRLQLLTPLIGERETGELALRPRLHVGDAERAAAREFLSRHGVDPRRPLVMIGALGSEPRKTYPLPAMARLLDRVVTRCSAQLLFNYMPSQSAEAERLYTLCSEATRARIVLGATPPGLRDFIAVLALCDALFGNEGGAVNMARALDVPSFSIFSPWIPSDVWGSLDRERHPSVHLADFAPELVAGRRTTALKRRAAALYAAFHSDWILPAADRFVDRLSDRTA